MKIKIYDNYLEEEIEKFKTDKRLKQYNENKINLLIFLVIITTILAYNTIYANQIFSREVHQVYVNKQLFPSSWKCSGCGYENYKGIKYCAICGTKEKK